MISLHIEMYNFQKHKQKMWKKLLSAFEGFHATSIVTIKGKLSLRKNFQIQAFISTFYSFYGLDNVPYRHIKDEEDKNFIKKKSSISLERIFYDFIFNV